MEQTLVIIKPDGVERKLIGRIIQRFEDKNLTIKEMYQGVISKDVAESHYAHLKDKSFFPELIAYMTSGPVVCLLLEGNDVIALVRQMLGATNILKAVPGTIRGDFACSTTENIVHASDSPENAAIEIRRFFSHL
ncbi:MULTISPECIES: nucleoside-diphosphate kinase [Enterococcus]|uniref:Nucleoside diphosphate kinase n=1 Tax=Candidatus Enterococcus ferrettii TaxID=2815324 RepID=A0ABV0EVB9_9ENTE|nr:nucleoside-diphosphate kinase [Enterococcus sp. 665A]MBO1341505.1 nucleoside-diphosphate kinase [Enterococcus sp. 665A]